MKTKIICSLLLAVVLISCKNSYVPATKAVLAGTDLSKVSFYLKSKTTWMRVQSPVKKEVKNGTIIQSVSAPEELTILPKREGALTLASDLQFDNGNNVPLFPMVESDTLREKVSREFVYVISDNFEYAGAQYLRISKNYPIIYVSKREVVKSAHVSKGYKRDKKPEKNKKRGNNLVE
jgi:hypothetical protein